MTISDYSQADCVYTLIDLEVVHLSDMQARANGRWESELCGGKERKERRSVLEGSRGAPFRVWPKTRDTLKPLLPLWA